MRPGIAISIAVHAGLVLCLAYALSFAPRRLTQEDPNTKTMVYLPPKPPPTPAKEVKTVPFHVIPVEPLKNIFADVKPLILPADRDFHRPTQTTETAEQPALPVIVNPVPISRGGLAFPDKAVEAGRSGYVDFAFTIEADGSVGDPVVVAEVPEGYGFAAAARKAFPTWKFKPKLVDNKPVAAAAQIRVSFQLK
jgi:TonB family protein